MKAPKPNYMNRPELRITSLSPKTLKTLYNIGINQGYATINDFIKYKLIEIVNTASDRDKQDPD